MSWFVNEARARLGRGDLRGAFRLASWAVSERFYERRYGVATSTIVSVADLATDPSLSEHYEPTSYSALHTLMRAIAPRRGDQGAVFLDVGCGKGRALIVAATHPYRRAIGIEITDRLARVARENVERARPRLRCANVDVVVADASTYSIPSTVSSVFLFAPFRGATTDRFMTRLRESLDANPRELRMAFLYPRTFDVAVYPWLRVVRERRCFHPSVDGMRAVVYETLG